jgi:predicted transcriptional regulator
MAAIPEPPPVLHELEAEVMHELWSRGESPVRTILDALNARNDKQRAYTTIMTIMARLHRKGLLERRRNRRGYSYAPRLSHSDYVEARARAEVGALVHQYGEVALVHFARHMAELDPARRAQLRRLAGR